MIRSIQIEWKKTMRRKRNSYRNFSRKAYMIRLKDQLNVVLITCLC